MTNGKPDAGENALVSKPMGAVSEAWSRRVYEFAEAFRGDPAEVKLDIEQHLHAGVYSRTIFQPAGVLCAAVLVRVPTQLIVCGHARIYCEGGAFDVKGYKVLEGLAGRQVMVYTYADTWGTMLFATKAKTFEEAEREFAGDDYRLLSTHREAQDERVRNSAVSDGGRSHGGINDLFRQQAGEGDQGRCQSSEASIR